MNTPEKMSTSAASQDQHPSEPLLTLRATVILLVAVLIGAVAGDLTYLAGHNVAAAVLAGLGAAGVTIPVLNALVGC